MVAVVVVVVVVVMVVDTPNRAHKQNAAIAKRASRVW